MTTLEDIKVIEQEHTDIDYETDEGIKIIKEKITRMFSYLLFLFLCLNLLQYTQPCSLPKCKPGTQHCIVVGSGGADCRGVLGCLKTCPPGSKHIGPLVPSKYVLSTSIIVIK